MVCTVRRRAVAAIPSLQAQEGLQNRAATVDDLPVAHSSDARTATDAAPSQNSKKIFFFKDEIKKRSHNFELFFSFFPHQPHSLLIKLVLN